jgi:hypothetical protein
MAGGLVDGGSVSLHLLISKAHPHPPPHTHAAAVHAADVSCTRYTHKKQVEQVAIATRETRLLTGNGLNGRKEIDHFKALHAARLCPMDSAVLRGRPSRADSKLPEDANVLNPYEYLLSII